MTLLDSVTANLDQHHIQYALIGAAALAVHGISRSTADQDLLVVDPEVLGSEIWMPIASSASVDIRPGDADDPLMGVVRLRARNERDVDIVVGRHHWQHEVLGRAVRMGSLPVVVASDLIVTLIDENVRD